MDLTVQIRLACPKFRRKLLLQPIQFHQFPNQIEDLDQVTPNSMMYRLYVESGRG